MENAGSSNSRDEKLSETQIAIQNFFPDVLEEVKTVKVIEPGNQVLPLARIKKIMKLDEDVKMISAEAPLLFAKATEIFIHELTLRAWLHTEDNKRRTLQRNDIAMAISKYDQFDFLIDIVPRDEIKPKKENETKSNQPPEVFYSIQMLNQTPTNQTTGIQSITVPTASLSQTPTQTLQLQNGCNLQTATTTSPQQNIILQSPTQQTVPTNLIQISNTSQPFQIVQQIVTPNGEISQIPIQMTPQQINLLRSQLPGHQQLLVQAPQTIFQSQSGPNIGISLNMGAQGLFLNPQNIQQHQQLQAQQHPQSHVKQDE